MALNYLQKFGVFILLLAPGLVTAQKIELTGTVFGYSGDQLKVIKKIQKNVSFEGMLGNVNVALLRGENVLKQSQTDTAGGFHVSIDNPGTYILRFFKDGYGYLDFTIKYISNTDNELYPGFFLLLKEHDETDTLHIGTYTIENGVIGFEGSKPNPDPQKEDNLANNITICKKAAIAINHLRTQFTPSPVEYVTKYIKIRDTVFVETDIDNDTIRVQHRLANLMGKMLQMDIDENNLEQWSKYLDSAKMALAELDTSSAEYKDLKDRIDFAEKKLEYSAHIIELKQSELSQANKKILYISLFATCLGLFLLLLGYLLIQRKKHLKLVNEKNEKITRINNNILSSIRYAGLIQDNFLENPSEFRDLFKHAFIYHKPKDIVSGDFYWFGKHNGFSIIVAADCTGHGVPGAMLTVLGHSAINNLVYTKGLTDPSKILKELNETILETFDTHDDYMPHGMDISIVAIKDNSHELKFCGAMNGIYLIRKSEVISHRAILKSLGTEINDEILNDVIIPLESNDLVVLFSDGYYDQFKGGTSKIEKFNIRRFKELLIELADVNPDQAISLLDKKLNDWKGNAEQIDDILVLGFKI